MVDLVGDSSIWLWEWRRTLFIWEDEVLSQLHNMLQQVRLNPLEKDRWVWLLDEDKGFSVTPTYNQLISLSMQLQDLIPRTRSKFWVSEAPSKVLVFSWRLLLDRLPSCEQLHKRHIQIQNLEASCYFCNSRKETTQHLFLMCFESIRVWHGIFGLLGVDIELPLEINLAC